MFRFFTNKPGKYHQKWWLLAIGAVVGLVVAFLTYWLATIIFSLYYNAMQGY